MGDFKAYCSLGHSAVTYYYTYLVRVYRATLFKPLSISNSQSHIKGLYSSLLLIDLIHHNQSNTTGDVIPHTQHAKPPRRHTCMDTSAIPG
ncbi:hypothetical protein J1614_004401 [Plenodomus biglobosus]|nr:hypothetical protein J1614_004401 [Plenodomus biglobosus]